MPHALDRRDSPFRNAARSSRHRSLKSCGVNWSRLPGSHVPRRAGPEARPGARRSSAGLSLASETAVLRMFRLVAAAQGGTLATRLPARLAAGLATQTLRAPLGRLIAPPVGDRRIAAVGAVQARSALQPCPQGVEGGRTPVLAACRSRGGRASGDAIGFGSVPSRNRDPPIPTARIPPQQATGNRFPGRPSTLQRSPAPSPTTDADRGLDGAFHFTANQHSVPHRRSLRHRGQPRHGLSGRSRTRHKGSACPSLADERRDSEVEGCDRCPRTVSPRQAAPVAIVLFEVGSNSFHCDPRPAARGCPLS